MKKIIVSIILIFCMMYQLQLRSEEQDFLQMLQACYIEISNKEGVMYANLIMKTLEKIIVFTNKMRDAGNVKEWANGKTYFLHVMTKECPETVIYYKFNME